MDVGGVLAVEEGDNGWLLMVVMAVSLAAITMVV